MAVALTRPTGPLSSGGGGGRDIVTYDPPAYDESQIKAYQQEAMATGVSGLRRAMRETQAGRYTSPSARREVLRGAMRGYGEALSSLQTGAGTQARQRYDIKYQQKIMAERQRVAATERQKEREYQTSLREEAREDVAERDRVVVGYNAAGGPVYMSRREAEGYYAALEAERGSPSEVVGLTEASRRPISDEPIEPGGLQRQPVAPGSAYPTNWMY